MTPVREAMSSSSLLPTDSEEVEAGETSRDGAEEACTFVFTGVASMTLLVVVRMTESKSARSKRVVAGMMLLMLLVTVDGGRQR
jgi:hypothetical protein